METLENIRGKKIYNKQREQGGRLGEKGSSSKCEQTKRNEGNIGKKSQKDRLENIKKCHPKDLILS